MPRQKTSIEIIKDVFWDIFFVAIGTVSEIIAISIIVEKPFNPIPLIIAFLSTLTIYLFDFARDEKDNIHYKSEHKLLASKRIAVLCIIIFSALSALFLALRFGSTSGFYILSIGLILSILYPIFFKNLTKKIVGFKDFFVAILWNLFIIFYLAFSNVSFDFGIIILLVVIFLRDFVNANYCDIKDIQEDREKGLLTIASIVGKTKLLKFVQALNILSILIILLFKYTGALPISTVWLIIPIIFVMIMMANSKRAKYSTAIVDSEYVLWAIILLIYLVL